MLTGLSAHHRMNMPLSMQHGEGFLGDLWDGVKKVGGFLKDSKILSTVGSMIPHPGVQAGARIIGQLGGRQKNRRVRKNVLKF